MAPAIRHIGVVGTGLVGASWTALFLAKGLDVTATDPGADAETKLRRFVDMAWPSLEQLGLSAGASRANLRFGPSLDVIKDAELVQESGPERLDLKQDLFARLDRLLPPETIIASSSSGLTMSAIQEGMKAHPERCLIAHPFNPPHLIPLVELVGGAATVEATIERAARFYDGLGKRTIRLKKEVPGHVANRLAAALWREVVHLVAEDVVSVDDVDAAVAWGPGLRWGIMGPALIYHLGGGTGGIDHFFEQFTEPFAQWWRTLGDPTMTPALQAKLRAGVLEEAAGRSIETLTAERDAALMALLQLRARNRPSR